MQGKIKLYIDSLRLDRWPRSLAFLPGLIAVVVLFPKEFHGISVVSIVVKSIIAFILTWFISTANYIINEITDAPYDAFHPTKRDRPLVKKEIKRRFLMLLWMLLIIISFIVSKLMFSLYFQLSLFSLLLAGIIYNVPPLRVKDIPVLDSTMESANNPIRFCIGWYVLAHSFPPILLLVSWWAFGNFLMVGKRVAEKKFLTEEESSSYRMSLKRYSLRYLILFMWISAAIFILSFIVFSIEIKIVTFLYGAPFILFYLMMFIKKSTQDRDGAEEPERLLKNPYFALYTIFLVVLFLLAYILR